MEASSPLAGHIPCAVGPGPQWRRVFPGEPGQLGLLRQWLRSLLREHPALDDMMVVGTELGSNAIKHTFSGRAGRFAVEVTRHRHYMRIAVSDDGAAGEPEKTGGPLAESGRGLTVVRALAERAGVSGNNCGRLVWAHIAWDGH